jgi:DNA-binding transcriptional ArsR family regulator
MEIMTSLNMRPNMEELAEKKAEIFQVFSNAKRVLIFWVLSKDELSVNEIAEAIDSSIQNTSQHLRLMKASKILESRRDGQTIYYSIADNEIGRYCKLIHEESLRTLNLIPSE